MKDMAMDLDLKSIVEEARRSMWSRVVEVADDIHAIIG